MAGGCFQPASLRPVAWRWKWWHGLCARTASVGGLCQNGGEVGGAACGRAEPANINDVVMVMLPAA